MGTLFSTIRSTCTTTTYQHPVYCTNFIWLYQWYPMWATWPSKGPQEKEKKLGHSNFWMCNQNVTAWIKYFKFKTESKVLFSPARHAAERPKFILLLFPHFIWLNLFSVGWFICVRNRPWCCEEMIFAYHWLLCNFKVFIRPKEHTDYNAN